VPVFPENREKYREFLPLNSSVREFCPKSANSILEQGISREFRKSAARPQQLWT
jgi:hypothetical protein